MERAQLGLPVGGDASLALNQDPSVEEVIDAAVENNLDAKHSRTSTSGSSANKLEEEWEWLMGQDEQLTELRKRALQGDLRASRIRSVYWRVLLGVLTAGKPESWLEETRQSRSSYVQLRNRLKVDPWNGHLHPEDNPLSQQAESPWNKYFCDMELRNVIKQDVIRTFPGVDFFRNEKIQEIMVNVLFCYARDHPKMCYRQGMHEVLAPLLFIIYCDHQAFIHTQELDHEVSETITELLDQKFVEEDSYALFMKVMFAIQGSYHIENVAPSSTGYFPNSPSGPVSENQVLQQLNWIRDNLLASAEPEIFDHLERLDIPLPLFGIRWLRLLFGREFPLQDLLVLWDAIFADGCMCELVNYLVVSMLSAIKNQLLSSDYTTCLSILMRYPTSVDVSHIIDYALHLKNPEVTLKPSTPTPQPSPSRQKPEKQDKPISRSKKLPVKRPPESSWSQSEARYDEASGSGIIDGFILEDPSVVRNELKHCRAVMSLAQIKLNQYYHVLELSVPDYPVNIHAQQALTGMQELCTLLDPHRGRPYQSMSMAIDPAYEVGETPPTPSNVPQSTPSNLPPPQSDVKMSTFKETEGEPKETSDYLYSSVKR